MPIGSLECSRPRADGVTDRCGGSGCSGIDLASLRLMRMTCGLLIKGLWCTGHGEHPGCIVRINRFICDVMNKAEDTQPLGVSVNAVVLRGSGCFIASSLPASSARWVVLQMGRLERQPNALLDSLRCAPTALGRMNPAYEVDYTEPKGVAQQHASRAAPSNSSPFLSRKALAWSLSADPRAFSVPSSKTRFMYRPHCPRTRSAASMAFSEPS